MFRPPGLVAVVVLALAIGWLTAPAQAAPPAPSVTALTVAPDDPAIGDVLTLTASVTSGGVPITEGEVWFDAAPSEAAQWGADMEWTNVSLTPVEGVALGQDGTATLEVQLTDEEIGFLEADTPFYVAAEFRPVVVDEEGQPIDPEFESSVSASVEVTVAEAPPIVETTTTVTGPDAATVDVPTTLGAVVEPATAAGSVQFRVGGSPVGSPVAVSNGAASLAHTFPTAGTATVTAVFTPVNTFRYAGSTSPVHEVAVAAPPTATTTTVTGPEVATIGSATSLTATVTPAGATGTVQFSVLGAPVGSPVPVTAGTASLPYTFPYVGDVTVGASFTPATPSAFTASAGSRTTALHGIQTSVKVVPTSATYGERATLAATVEPANAMGRVAFSVDGVAVGDGEVRGGRAELRYEITQVSKIQVTAEYRPPSPTYRGSTDAVGASIPISPKTGYLSLHLLDSEGTTSVGRTSSVLALVSLPGTVRFTLPSGDVRRVTAMGGKAELSWVPRRLGMQTVKAAFEPADPAKHAGSSAALDLDVGLVPGPDALLLLGIVMDTFNVCVFQGGNSDLLVTSDEVRRMRVKALIERDKCGAKRGSRGSAARAQTLTVDCVSTAEGLVCPMGRLPAGTSVTLQPVAGVRAAAAGRSVPLTATARTTDPDTGQVTTLGTWERTVKVPKKTALGVTLVPTTKAAAVKRGATSTYRIKLKNGGRYAADDVRTCVRLSPGAKVRFASSSGRVQGRQVCWTLSTLGKGRSVTRTFTLVAPPRKGRLSISLAVLPKKRQADPVRLRAVLPVR